MKTITETRIDRDRDNDWHVDTGATAITHYHGDTVDTADLFTIDAPDPLTPAELAAHIRGAQALLDFIDPTRVNRLPNTACDQAMARLDEDHAVDIASRHTPEQVRHQLQFAARFPETVDPDELAVWQRAAAIQAGAA